MKFLMWVCVASLMLLASCSSTPPMPEAGLSAGPPVSSFVLSGRISIREGQQVEMASVRWQRDAGSEEILILSPLGSVVARLSREGAQPASLQAGGKVTEAGSLDELTRQALGTAVPVSALGWWLQGRTSDGLTTLGASRFGHDGWEVMLERVELMAGSSIARRVNASRGEVTVRLIVDEWSPRP